MKLARRSRDPHWIRRTHLFERDVYECSRCGKRFREAVGVCPNCGAFMKGMEDGQDWVDEAEELDWLLEDD